MQHQRSGQAGRAQPARQRHGGVGRCGGGSDATAAAAYRHISKIMFLTVLLMQEQPHVSKIQFTCLRILQLELQSEDVTDDEETRAPSLFKANVI